MFFQFVFCAVSLAIVWGATLERIKFSAYIIYAVIFSAVLYPILSHWIFGGGWLQVNVGMQDFAGSTVVHLIGATGAFAALLLLGPRIGKYTKDGKPRAIPGHSMPLVGLGVLILWLGWFGFNPGSTLGAIGGRFAEVVVVTNLAAAAGVVAAVAVMYLLSKTIDIGMAGNGAIAGLVAITAPSGYVEYWAAPIIGAIAGVIVVLGVLAIEKIIDDPVGATSAHGLAGIWGTLACGIFTSPRLAEFNEVGDPGLWYSGSFHQLGAQALGSGGRLRVCVRGLVRDLLHRSRRRSGYASAPRRRTPASTSPSTGCTGTRSSSSRSPSTRPACRSAAHHHRSALPRRRLSAQCRPPSPRRTGRMKKIEAFIRHEAFEPIRAELLDKGFPSLSIIEAKGSGRQKGIVERYRGSTLTVNVRPKVKLEIVVEDKDKPVVVETILKHARTGEVGDGKIFVIPVEEAIRIRTGEGGEPVLQLHEESEIPG